MNPLLLDPLDISLTDVSFPSNIFEAWVPIPALFTSISPPGILLAIASAAETGAIIPETAAPLTAPDALSKSGAMASPISIPPFPPTNGVWMNFSINATINNSNITFDGLGILSSYVDNIPFAFPI